MSPFAYRASDELADALRAYAEEDRAFRARVIERDQQHPGREVMWARSPFSADLRPMGFADTTDEVPEGLSRRKGRTSLTPKRGKAGEPWREVLDEMSKRPQIESVLRRFGVPAAGRGGSTGSGGHYLAPTQFIDGGDDGVLVVCKYDLATDPLHPAGQQAIGEHLTPIPLSEFYTVKERLDATKAEATS